mgnify:FL=1
MNPKSPTIDLERIFLALKRPCPKCTVVDADDDGRGGDTEVELESVEVVTIASSNGDNDDADGDKKMPDVVAIPSDKGDDGDKELPDGAEHWYDSYFNRPGFCLEDTTPTATDPSVMASDSLTESQFLMQEFYK